MGESGFPSEFLGLDGDAVVFRISAGRLLRQSRESLTNPSTLISLASQQWWCRLADSDTLGSATARRIGDSLIRAADDIGQVDLARVTGRGAVEVAGKTVWHLGDRLLADGKEIGLDQLGGRIWLAEPRIELGAAASEEGMRAVAEAVMAYRWDTPDDGRRFLGWMVAAVVGGALEWRPHLILTAPAAVGKSWLVKNVLDRVISPVAHKIADGTPAALARLTDMSSLPIVVDEAEYTSPWVVELFKLLRISAGQEGMRVCADNASGGVVMQQPRFAALLSCTGLPEMHRADASRMSVVRLGRAVEHWPTVQAGIREAMEHADAVRYRIIRRTPEIVQSAMMRATVFQELGMDSREAMASAALTAGWHAWGLDDKDVYAHEADREETTDGLRCLRDILALRYRLPSGHEVSVLEMLRDGHSEAITKDQFGIKTTRLGTVDVLAILPSHSGLRDRLSRTDWAKVNLRQLLEQQVEHAQYGKTPLHFGGQCGLAITIPLAMLAEKHGITLDKAAVSADDQAEF